MDDAMQLVDAPAKVTAAASALILNARRRRRIFGRGAAWRGAEVYLGGGALYHAR
jgi:hypothetical protein